MRKTPWHSTKKGTRHYHNNGKCGPGGEIPDRNRATGPGTGLTLCEDCKKLNRDGK